MNKKVKELRKALGLTMEKFGERLGVKKNTVSQWESGTNALSDQMLKAICNVNWDGKFVNEDWLLGNSDKMFKDESNGELEALAKKYNLSHNALVVIEKFVKMKESDQQVLLGYYKEVAAALSSEDAPTVKSFSGIDSKSILSGKNLDGLSDEEFGKFIRGQQKIQREVTEKSGA
ncbi:helix-turn-helix domain-containing protein [Lachnospiraceae bacterium 29-84]